jgi:uncharacterized protein
VNSRLYTGTVAHTRSGPSRNSFAYKVYFVYVDLAEIDDLDARLRRFGHDRHALISLWDADHGPRDGTGLRPWIDTVLARAGIDLAGGRVGLLAIPRVFGLRFYPVSFWYCFHADGSPRAVLAEVQNTYRDHHDYLLHNGGKPFDWSSRPTAAKAFYVSPFVRLDDVCYEFAFSAPGPMLSVVVSDRVDDAVLLRTTLALTAEDMTDAALARVVRRMGPMSGRAMVLIAWQALRLVTKGVSVYPHTPPPEEEVSW